MLVDVAVDAVGIQEGEFTAADVLGAMGGHVPDTATLTATYTLEP